MFNKSLNTYKNACIFTYTDIPVHDYMNVNVFLQIQSNYNLTISVTSSQSMFIAVYRVDHRCRNLPVNVLLDTRSSVK